MMACFNDSTVPQVISIPYDVGCKTLSFQTCSLWAVGMHRYYQYSSSQNWRLLSYIFEKTNHGFQVKKNLIFQRLHQIRCIKNICTQFTRHVFAAFCLDLFLLWQGLTLMRLCIWNNAACCNSYNIRAIFAMQIGVFMVIFIGGV